MPKILAISEDITTFRQVETKLGLTLTENHEFFTEWMDELPPLSELEQARLQQVRRNYLYQISDGILLEETIKMVVLSPLLELAGFYQAPYKFRAEVSVEIAVLGDNDEILNSVQNSFTHRINPATAGLGVADATQHLPSIGRNLLNKLTESRGGASPYRTGLGVALAELLAQPGADLVANGLQSRVQLH